MAENIRETPLPGLNQYSKDDLTFLFQHMIDNPPKFQNKKWVLGDFTLSVRLGRSRNSREDDNKSINHDVPVSREEKHYAFVTFSTQVAQEIYAHIKKEFEKYYEYQFNLAEIHQALHSPFSQNNAWLSATVWQLYLRD